MFIGLLAFLAPAPKPAQAVPQYHLLRRFVVGGDGFWDYISLDSTGRRLFISRGTHVQVVDTRSGKVAGDVTPTPGVHGIVMDTKAGKGYTSNGGNNTVTVFNLKTYAVITSVPVGTGPDAIVFEPVNHRVFTFNGRSGDATAVDTSTDNVAGTVPLDGRPEFAVADGRGNVFCNIEDKSEVQEIDGHTLQVTHTWPIAPGDGPSGIAMDRAGRRVFSVCGNNYMTVLNADTGAIVATPAIGNGPDAADYDPMLHIAFSSNGEGSLTLVPETDPDHFGSPVTVKTEAGARTMAEDPRSHRVYLVTAKFKPADPAAQPAGQRRRRQMEPNSFVVLVYGP